MKEAEGTYDQLQANGLETMECITNTTIIGE